MCDGFLWIFVAGHCQRFAPLFIKAATTYADVDVSFMALDCVKHRDVCTEQKIKSYPTIRGYGFGTNFLHHHISFSYNTSTNILLKYTPVNT